MHLWAVLIVATAAALIDQVFDEEKDEADYGMVIDDAILDKYIKQIGELRAQGKSWREIDQIMGIWWPEGDERY